jgi:hypothetical protein
MKSAIQLTQHATRLRSIISTLRIHDLLFNFLVLLQIRLSIKFYPTIFFHMDDAVAIKFGSSPSKPVMEPWLISWQYLTSSPCQIKGLLIIAFRHTLGIPLFVTSLSPTPAFDLTTTHLLTKRDFDFTIRSTATLTSSPPLPSAPMRPKKSFLFYPILTTRFIFQAPMVQITKLFAPT